VFVAVGREIRWGDLVYLKDAFQDQESAKFMEVRVKRENSTTDFEVYDEEFDQPGPVEKAQGSRVSAFLSPGVASSRLTCH
jgi:hypothetical protein